MTTSPQESNRDNAMTRLLVDVQNTVGNWASSSSDGALVWSIANEFRELWHDWGLALGQPVWNVPNLVVHALEVVADNANDHAVRASVDVARQAIMDYRE
jgi:hypothetical protein